MGEGQHRIQLGKSLSISNHLKDIEVFQSLAVLPELLVGKGPIEKRKVKCPSEQSVE
jgi:hypothetical protein